MTGLAILQSDSSVVTLASANGDALVARDGTLVDLSTLRMISLETVWVPGAPEIKVDANGKQIPVQIRGSALGPNGEGPDEGRWRLRLPMQECPEHLGQPGTIYTGPTLSASSTETYSECAMKWSLEKLDNWEKPANRKAEMGGERHLELNRWLVYGSMPTTPGMGKVITHFPMPGQCESECFIGFIFGRPGHEVVFAGYVDARQMPTPAGFIDDTGPYGDEGPLSRAPLNPIILDLKTTGDFRWKKSGAQLRVNLQAAIYSLDAMMRSDRGFAILKWVYALLKEPGHILRVETVNEEDSSKNPDECGGVLLTRSEAVATVARYVVQYGEAMVDAILRKASASEMAKNIDACSLYGGCPWLKVGACTPPQGGGGFRSMLAKERVKLGVLPSGASSTGARQLEAFTPEVPALTSKLASRFAKGLTAEPVEVPVYDGPREASALSERFSLGAEKKMSALAGRFAGLGKAVAEVEPAPVKAAAPPPTPPKAVTPAKPSAASRFGPKGVAKKPAESAAVAEPAPGEPVASPAAAMRAGLEKAAEVAETPKLELKATTDGVASGVAPAAPSPAMVVNGVDGAPGGGGAGGAGNLLTRLTALAKTGGANANTDAVAAAINTAETKSVQQTSVGAAKEPAHAHGINPPDVAREWTDEEQDAEAAKIAGRTDAAGEKKVPLLVSLPTDSPTAQTLAANVAANTPPPKAEGGTVAKKGRGPAKPKADAASITAPEPSTIEGAIEILDNLTMALVAGKQRLAAAKVAETVAALEMLQEAQQRASAAPAPSTVEVTS